MEKFRSLENLKAQLTVVRWHLHAAAEGDAVKKRQHLDSAGLTYQGALELMRQLALPDGEHAAIKAQLTELADRLQLAGEAVG